MKNRWPEIESASQWLPDGTVLSFEYDQRAGPALKQRQPLRRTSGTVTDGRVTWEKLVAPEAGSRTQTTRSDWPSGAGGYFALEQSCRGRPMQPGERRRVTALVPLLDTFVETQLTALGREQTELLGEKRLLLPAWEQ